MFRRSIKTDITVGVSYYSVQPQLSYYIEIYWNVSKKVRSKIPLYYGLSIEWAQMDDCLSRKLLNPLISIIYQFYAVHEISNL